MAGYEKDGEGEEALSRNVDWEVVSLTASAYRNTYEENLETSKYRNSDEDNIHCAREMFMSGHFVFPPAAHENLPLQPDSKLEDTGNESDKDVKNSSIEEATGEEEDMSSSPELRFDDQTVEGDDSGSNKILKSSPETTDESSDGGSRFPSESWWKNRAAVLYSHAKEAGAFWSLCAAAALVGLVILGHKWHQEKWKSHHHGSRFCINTERASRLMGSVSRIKKVIAGGPH
ncbi:mesoderm induction early response protein [Wolffia australiana]